MNSEHFNKHQSETKDTIKKRDIRIKEENTKYKRGIEQRYRKPQKKESNRNPGNKSPYSQTKNTMEGHSTD
jgi:hypothetical protein